MNRKRKDARQMIHKELELYQMINHENVGAVLIHNRYSCRYLTGYCGDTGVAYISKTKKAILTDFRYTFQAEKEAKGFEIIDITEIGYAKGIANLAMKDQVTLVGFEACELSYEQYQDYANQFGDMQLRPMKRSFESLRMVKEDWELANIRMAEHIGDITFDKILNDIKPGVSEIEIAAKLEYYMKTNGAEAISFDPIVASGIHSSMPHAVPSEKKIEIGDFVTLDFGCKYHGYCSDMTRTIVVGKATDQQKEIYHTVLQAQMEVLGQLKAGMIGKSVDKIARDIIYAAGFEGCFGHGLGHSVGLFIHENPRASVKSEDVLLENETLTIEPGIYVKNVGGVRIEDLVIIKRDGSENLTFSEKKLIEL